MSESSGEASQTQIRTELEKLAKHPDFPWYTEQDLPPAGISDAEMTNKAGCWGIYIFCKITGGATCAQDYQKCIAH